MRNLALLIPLLPLGLVSMTVRADDFANWMLRHGSLDPFEACDQIRLADMTREDARHCDVLDTLERAIKANRAAYPPGPSPEETAAEHERKRAARAAEHYIDPNAASLCPPPRQMTRDGCQ